jgi:hypothetical protein
MSTPVSHSACDPRERNSLRQPSHPSPAAGGQNAPAHRDHARQVWPCRPQLAWLKQRFHTAWICHPDTLRGDGIRQCYFKVSVRFRLSSRWAKTLFVFGLAQQSSSTDVADLGRRGSPRRGRRLRQRSKHACARLCVFPPSTVVLPTYPLGGAWQAPGGRWLQNGWLEVKELLPLMAPALRGSVSASSPFVYVDVGCKDAAEGVFVLETFPEGAQVQFLLPTDALDAILRAMQTQTLPRSPCLSAHRHGVDGARLLHALKGWRTERAAGSGTGDAA